MQMAKRGGTCKWLREVVRIPSPLTLADKACLVYRYPDSQRLQFMTNAGEGQYRFAYNETYITDEGTVISGPLPPGLFRVTCRLDGQPSPNILYANLGGDGGTFLVNETTGTLSLAEGIELDYETITNYIFSVSCSEPSVGPAIAQVNFAVLPVNEFDPVLSPATLFVLTSESDPIGRVLVSTLQDVGALRTFSATDMDEGPDGELRYTLAFNENLTSFNVDDETGTLTISQILDVDNTVSGFFTQEIRLTVCDIRPPVNTCPTLILSVIITSANDNDPVFSQDEYQVSLPEDVPAGSIITEVSCTDHDVGMGRFKNVTSSSSLFDVTASPFEQLQTISLLNMSGVLDFETARTHTVTLTCYDTGDVSTTATLIVTVEPVNDNEPTFSMNQYSFTMNRIETTGNEIGRVVANDPDQVVGGELTYTLMGNDNFQIQSDGSIILSDFVYVVEGQTFDLQVTVSDGEFSDTARVQITVNGVLSVPEIILTCMGAIIFLVLVVFLVIFSCYCCVCCSRLIPKQRHVHVEVPVPVPVMHPDGPMGMPMTMMGDMYNQGKAPIMIGQVPAMGGHWGSQSMGEEEETDEEGDQDMGSFVTQSSRVYSPTPYLKEMVDMFKEGDEILLKGKKPKKKE